MQGRRHAMHVSFPCIFYVPGAYAFDYALVYEGKEEIVMCGILSWNMQGWSRTGGEPEEKKKALLDLLDNHMRVDAVFGLQECGDPRTSGIAVGRPFTTDNGKSYTCRWVEIDHTADVNRCTTAIFASSNLEVTGGSCYPSGVTRPVLYVVVNRRLIATVHAIANEAESVEQIKAVMTHFESMRNRGEITSWILMGDFNSSPECYVSAGQSVYFNIKNRIQFSGTGTRLQKYAWMVVSRTATQGEGGERTRRLDYAFLSDDLGTAHVTPFLGGAGELLGNVKVRNATNQVLSDHNLVGMYI